MPRFAKPIPPAIKDWIHYDPEIGECRWKRSPATNLPEGSLAGGLDKSKGYIRVKFSRSTYYIHRIAWYLYYDEDPPQDLDHINGIRTDNRIVNLRSLTRDQNCSHRTVLNSNNTSGICGVYWHKRDSCWVVSIRKDKKSLFYAQCNLFQDAEALMNKKKLELLGDLASIG